MSAINPQGMTFWRDRDESSGLRKLLIGSVLALLLLLEGFRYLLCKLVEIMLISPLLASWAFLKNITEPTVYMLGFWWQEEAEKDWFFIWNLLSRSSPRSP